MDAVAASLNGCHIFHTPYLRLPPRELTGRAVRFLTIHDLIPIDTPHFVTAKATEAFQAIIQSIDIKRDWVVCNSEYTRQTFCAFTRMDPTRTFVTPLAPAPHLTAQDERRICFVRDKFGLPSGPYFLSVGDIQPRKNLARVIRSVQRVRQELPEVSLVLVGATYSAGEERPDAGVLLPGHVPDANLAALYSGATALVFPSLYEGFGLPVLEAMQCGTPVITSNTSSLPEVAGDAALLVDPTDEDALSQAMLDVLRDERLRLRLRCAGLERAAQFTWERCAELTAAAYQHAMESRE
jgi:glycosyltransferase involved in cell wall biosynthesis